jgi:hypothetical protein
MQLLRVHDNREKNVCATVIAQADVETAITRIAVSLVKVCVCQTNLYIANNRISEAVRLISIVIAAERIKATSLPCSD